MTVLCLWEKTYLLADLSQNPFSEGLLYHSMHKMASTQESNCPLLYCFFSVVFIALEFGCVTNQNRFCQLPHEENGFFFNLIFQNLFQ